MEKGACRARAASIDSVRSETIEDGGESATVSPPTRTGSHDSLARGDYRASRKSSGSPTRGTHAGTSGTWDNDDFDLIQVAGIVGHYPRSPARAVESFQARLYTYIYMYIYVLRCSLSDLAATREEISRFPRDSRVLICLIGFEVIKLILRGNLYKCVHV